MLLPFRLISASLKQLSRDITNDIIVKQPIWRHVIFVKLRISKIPLKKATAKTSSEIIVLTSCIPLNSCLDTHTYTLYNLCIHPPTPHLKTFFYNSRTSWSIKIKLCLLKAF